MFEDMLKNTVNSKKKNETYITCRHFICNSYHKATIYSFCEIETLHILVMEEVLPFRSQNEPNSN